MTKTQSAKPKATDGATWLQQKAQDHRRLSQDRVDTLEPVTKALGPLALRDQKLRTHRNGLALDLLVDRKTVDHVLLTLAEGLRQNGPRDLLGWACALVGPLPVYSFAEAA